MKKIITTIAVVCLTALALTGCTKMNEESIGTLDDYKNFIIEEFAIDTTVSQEEKDAKKEFYINNFSDMDLKPYGNTLSAISDGVVTKVIIGEDFTVTDIKPIITTDDHLVYLTAYKFLTQNNKVQKYSTISIVDNTHDNTAETITLEYEPVLESLKMKIEEEKLTKQTLISTLQSIPNLTISDVEVTAQGYDIITITNLTETIIITLDVETGFVYAVDITDSKSDRRVYMSYTQTDPSIITAPKNTTTSKLDILYYTFKFLKDYAE
jgi:hypothetical protein